MERDVSGLRCGNDARGITHKDDPRGADPAPSCIGTTRTRLRAWLTLAGLLGGVATLATGYRDVPIGTLFWLALALSWSDLDRNTKRIAIVATALSVPGIVLGLRSDGLSLATDLANANLWILLLLVSVGLAASSIPPTIQASDPTYMQRAPRRASLRLFAVIHLVGAVINFSIVMLVGKRLQRGVAVPKWQAVLVARAFATAGFWSPFFVTVAVATNYAPALDYLYIALIGGAISILGLGFSLWELSRRKGTYEAVPPLLDSKTVRLSTLLATGVVGGSMIAQTLNTVEIVTVVATVIGMLLVLRYPSALRWTHIFAAVNRHAGALALFLSVGCLSLSLPYVLSAFLPGFSPQPLGETLASVWLVSIILLSFIGIHPMVTIGASAPFISASPDHANLLAFAIVSGWSIGSFIGPFSGQTLGICAAYHIDNFTLVRGNSNYALFLTALSIGCIVFLLG